MISPTLAMVWSERTALCSKLSFSVCHVFLKVHTFGVIMFYTVQKTVICIFPKTSDSGDFIPKVFCLALNIALRPTVSVQIKHSV